MSTAAQTTPGLLTAEEFARRPDPGHPEELEAGRVVPMPPPGGRHGQVCGKVCRILGNFVEEHDLGHVLSNDSGVITARGPDSVRGPDVSFYRDERLPKGPLAKGYPDVPPDLVVEILSPDDRWPKVLAKVAEYLNAGVAAVAVLDSDEKTLHLFGGGRPRILVESDVLTLPALLGEFRVAVGRFFEG